MKKTLLAVLLLSTSLAAFAQNFKTLDRVDPDYREAVKSWAVDLGDADVRRRFQENNARRATEGAQPIEHWVAPAQGQQPSVSLYVYKPKNATAKPPVIYFIHGGGYVLGNAKMAGDSLQALADQQQAAVVSLEYRLATEAPFPADLRDAYHGLSYVYRHAAQHGIDSERVVLMGESAGGGLAARLALYTRDKGEFTPEGQVLIYPMLDYRTGTTASPYRNTVAGEFVWTPNANRYGWSSLRGGQTIASAQMPYFSPAMAKDLRDLPPTFMMVGDLDLFVNEDVDYANRLVQAGVKTDFQLISGVYHAFEMLNPNSPQTKAYKAARTDAINRMLNE